MTQPTAYNPTTDFSEEEVDGVSGRSTLRNPAIDVELANLATTIGEILFNLAIIQRDDTKLQDRSVEMHTLSDAVRAIMATAGTTPRGGWLTATAYAVKDVVNQGTGTYLCVTAHTSGVFATDLAAGKWLVLFNSASYIATNIVFTPAGTIAAINVQAAIEEVAGEALQKSANLADVASASASRTSLGLAIANKGGLLVGAGAGAITELAVVEGARPIGDATQAGGIIWVPDYPRSIAPNPFFAVDQLANAATARADDTYGHDHWNVLTQTASIQVSTQTVQENGQAQNVRLTQNQAAAQRFGYACMMESKDSIPYRGKQLTFRPRVRISNSQAIRIAVLEWTGAADTITSDVVLDWTNGTFTAGQFFLAANLTVTGVGAKTPAGATWTDMDALTVTVGNGCNNLIVFVWTETVAAQNVTLDIGKVRLVPGAYAGEIAIPTFEETLALAQRQFEKNFNYATAPQTAAGFGYTLFSQIGAAGTTIDFFIPFKVRKRVAPIVTDVPLYNPAAANTQMRNTTAGADCTFTTAGNFSEVGFDLTAIAAAGSAATQKNYINWAAGCRL